MLFAMRHGQRILTDTTPLESSLPQSRAGDRVSIRAAAGAIQGATALETALSLPEVEPTRFGYFFPDARGDDRPGMAEAFSTLAAAMMEPEVGPNGEDTGGNSKIPPVMTYFGQFIDHDATANTDRTVTAPDGTVLSTVTGPSIDPVARSAVTSGIVNLRKGSLELDSLYGDGPFETAFTLKVKAALRDPQDRARMRIGSIQVIPFGHVIPVPGTDKGDLPRLGDVLDDPTSGLSEADIDALTDPDLKSVFKTPDGVNRWNAVIGDGRNDENLIVAQLHLAFLHFHNAVADDLKSSIPDAEDRFAEARRRTTWMYQWLIVNAYLPAICDPAVVTAVKAAGAPLYRAFRARVAPNGPELPMPLEFSVAAFRFGHSMVRGAYDHNRNFGRPTRPSGATFDELFSFTGGGKLGQAITGQAAERLVSNWPIEWDRFTSATPAHSDRLARKIDTRLAHPLSVLLKEGEGQPVPLKAILKQLADRNLRRGYRLNIPTGQATVAALNAFDGGQGGGGYAPAATKGSPSSIQPLSAAELTNGVTGAALSAADLEDATPLWFYILKEAEERAGGEHLGALGSRLVAETLIGLIVEDPGSYWHAASQAGAWTPDLTPVAGIVVSDMATMFAVCGLMPAASVPA